MPFFLVLTSSRRMSGPRFISRTISTEPLPCPPGTLMMKLFVRLIAIALFIVFFDFALKNTDEVVLYLFWNAQASTPLILLLLVFLVCGVIIGALAMTGTVLRYRRELGRLRAEAKPAPADITPDRNRPPAADALVEQVGL